MQIRSFGCRSWLTLPFSPGQLSRSGAITFDDDADKFIVGYTGIHGFGSVTWVYDFEHAQELPPNLSGPTCGSTAQFGWYGSVLVGDENCGVRMAGLPQNALAATIIALTPHTASLAGVPPVRPSCFLLVPNVGPSSLGTLGVGFGPDVAFPFPLRESLPAMTLYFQGAHFDATGTQVLTTQRLAVDIVR